MTMDDRTLSRIVPPIRAIVPTTALLRRPRIQEMLSFHVVLGFANSFLQQPLNCQPLRPAGTCLEWRAVALVYTDDIVLVSECLRDL